MSDIEKDLQLDGGFYLSEMVQAQRGFSDREFEIFLATGKKPDLSQPPPEELERIENERPVMSEQDAYAWLSGATLTASSFYDFDSSRNVSPLYDEVVRPKALRFDPRQPRDGDGKWSDSAGGGARDVITNAISAVFSPKGGHNRIVAESENGDRRIRVNVTPAKYVDKMDYVVERRDGDGWDTEAKLIGPDARAKIENEPGQWFTPREETATDAPAVASPPSVSKPAPKKVSPVDTSGPLSGAAAAQQVPQLSARSSDGYVVEGFTWNALLRGQDERSMYPESPEEVSAAERGIDTLKREFTRTPPLTRPITVERGISDASMTLPYILGSGKQFTDKGFVSTTTEVGVANSYAMMGGDDADIAIMRITVPKGFKALRVGPVNFGEVLLPPGTQFKVTNDETVDGARVLNVEVVGQ